MRSNPFKFPGAHVQGWETRRKIVKSLLCSWNWQQATVPRAQTEVGVIAIGGRIDVRAV